MDSVLIVQAPSLSISPVRTWLARAGCTVESCTTEAAALEMATRLSLDLIFIDCDTIDNGDTTRPDQNLLPYRSFSARLLALLRKEMVTTPILVQTLFEDEDHERIALELGADDVIPKRAPLSLVMARVQAHLRRQYRDLGLHLPRRQEVRIGNITLDRRGHALITDDATVVLTIREMRILERLAANPARVVPVPELLNVIATGETPSIRALSGLLRRLKMKMNESGLPNPVENHRSRGFRLSSRITLWEPSMQSDESHSL